MQFAGNAALAAALATGQKREFSVSLAFDWDRNGAYANANSDMSAVYESGVIDRQLSGSFPADMEITEGYVAAQLDITVSGKLADNTPVWQAFSPYSGYPLGSISIEGTPMRLDLIVQTSLGPVTIRQFTGFVFDALPSRANGNVVITCYDAGFILAALITLATWAVDGVTRTQLTSNPDTPDSGTVALGWVIENILRRNGFYQGPPWHPNVVCAWTLNGAALPEVGTIAIEDPWITGVWSFGYGEYNIPQFTPSGQVSDVYTAGQFGSTCYRGATKLPVITGRGVSYLYGNAHASWNQQFAFNVGSYGSANSNLIGFGAWVQIDPTQAGSSTITCYLEEAHFNFSSTDQHPAFATVSVNHATGAASATVQNEGATTTWTYTATGSLSAGWHYVNFVLSFASTAITGQFIMDGVSQSTGTGGHATTPIGAFTYSNANAVTNLCQVIARGPMQYAQVYLQLNTALAGHVQPTRSQASPTANVDRCLTRLTWLPNVAAAPSWDTLKAVAGAELGALYVTEQGVVTFDSRTTVTGRQLAGSSVLDLTLDQVQDISPQSVASSLANIMTYTCRSQHAQYQSPIYSTSKADQYQVPAASSQTWAVTNSGVQSIRHGNLLWHPQAQGYSNPSAPSEPGGAGPSGGFTYRDWMNIYGPAFWYNGFTAYSPGASDPAAQPAAATGLNAFPMVGLLSTDQDSRSMRLVLSNGNASGGVLEYAVNDATPFLHVGGTVLVDDGSTTSSYTDAPSVGTYGQQSATFPASDWVQDPSSVLSVVLSVVNYTRNPHPFFQSIQIVGDPRLQLQDVVTVRDPSGMGATMPASVFGINRRISIADGVNDQLTLRTF